MFAKPFRVKSNTVIKGSDRRKLKADISAAFPSLSADELSELVPNKEEINVVKIYAHKGEAVTLYVLHKNPLFFELEKRLYPTVYVLWRYPALLPTLRTWTPVLQKLIGGADLMLPGVVVPSSGLPDVKRGDCCAVTLVNNRAPVAVGTAAVSSAEMHSSGMKGRGVCVVHTYMDNLWAFGDKSVPPSLPDIENDGQRVNGDEFETDEEEEEEEEKEEVETCVEEERSAGEMVTDQVCSGIEELTLAEQKEEEGEKGNEEEEENQDDQKTPQEIMDALLVQCFLHALKSKVKKSELPLLTSTFLRNHMFACCPNGKQLDIKKSSYKKLSKFLQAMQQQHNLVRVKELTKGVESIVEVDWKNPELRYFNVLEETGGEAAPVQDGGEGETPYHPPEITTLYSVSARLEPLFLEANKRKGAILQPVEVRNIVTEYVKKNELVDGNNKNYVTINPTLCDCLLEKSEYQEVESLKWDDLFSRTLRRMQECYQVVFPGQTPMIKKGHIEPIDISVASRGSNKKVTLIKNLEVYCLDPAVVATTLQRRVQASSVLQPIPGAKDKVLVQIQGNQIHQVGSLLLDHYQIPRKYIQGLDKALKGGKKK
ncbi:eukaryotic translation initiation factor 2D [Seriola lalandi dorsalis]|uniref:Eukaryotic translation initiation factor 2D n=1 Tax=Seriola lalandi dorsalis TaxID=1841481 RepID=A0A3B4WTU9_SERLL|nr:eukaryotic translation initiation factor 2D [Seriola lalandi dorsalis]XP_056240565.1 eukaryotic translation initiation factor 2D isoform X1 [Seriola aureovittata]